ncbi:hypothetical protein QE406_001158 [Microbacterium testaceum]|uniref:hypothetical protein n=1 Tax=Microbacterium testaceum TaxID=2033 RepID=UPI002789B3CE|nr:hypothetical protein [Microbacterium testaceum]MDQ1115149.1 hypothetical protein [Microbacterium testaceum]
MRWWVASGHGFTLLNQQPKLSYTYSGGELHRLAIVEPTRPLDIVLARRSSVPLTRKASLFAAEARRAVDSVLHGRVTEPAS